MEHVYIRKMGKAPLRRTYCGMLLQTNDALMEAKLFDIAKRTQLNHLIRHTYCQHFISTRPFLKMSSMVSTSGSFEIVYGQLLKLRPPLLPPGKATIAVLTNQISSLYLHPTLEAAFHLLNCDLPSAHFLVRHMQATPADEGMYLHGILHRIEGDYDNARAWYENVASSEVFKNSWNDKDKAFEFIGKVEALNKRKEGDMETLERQSVEEIKRIVDFCVEKFGKEKIQDASVAWKQPEDEELKKLGQDMVSGGKGFRQFEQ